MKIPVEATKSTREAFANVIERAGRESGSRGDKGVITDEKEANPSGEFLEPAREIADKVRADAYPDEDVMEVLSVRRQARMRALSGLFKLPLPVDDNELGNDLWTAGNGHTRNGKGELYSPVVLGHGSVNTPHEKCDYVFGPDAALGEQKNDNSRFNDCCKISTLEAMDPEYRRITAELHRVLPVLGSVVRNAGDMPAEVRDVIPAKMRRGKERLNHGHMQYSKLRTTYRKIQDAVRGNEEAVVEAIGRGSSRDVEGVRAIADGGFISLIEQRRKMVTSLIWREKDVDLITHAVSSRYAAGNWPTSHVLFGITTENACNRFYVPVGVNSDEHKIHPRPIHRNNKRPEDAHAQVLNAVGGEKGPVFIHMDGKSLDEGTNTVSGTVQYDVLYSKSTLAVVDNLRGQLPYDYDISDKKPKMTVHAREIKNLECVDSLVDFADLVTTMYGKLDHDDVLEHVKYVENLVHRCEDGVIDFNAELQGNVHEDVPLSSNAFNGRGDNPRKVEVYVREVWERIYGERPETEYEIESSGPLIRIGDGGSMDGRIAHKVSINDVLSGGNQGSDSGKAEKAEVTQDESKQRGREYETAEDIAEAIAEGDGFYHGKEKLYDFYRDSSLPLNNRFCMNPVFDVLEEKYGISESDVKRVKDDSSGRGANPTIGFKLK